MSILPKQKMDIQGKMNDLISLFYRRLVLETHII